MDPRDRHARLKLHRRGHQGGAILPHRSIWSLRLPRGRLAGGVAVALGFTVLLLWLEPRVAEFWGWQMLWWMQALGLPGQFALPEMGELSAGLAPLSLPVPLIDTPMPATDPLTPLAHGLGALLVWVLAGWLPDNAKPATYLLRFGVIIHLVSALYFLVWPASFNHSLTSHVSSGLRQSWVLLLITPWLHLATYYLFPFALWQRLALTTLTLAYLLALAPLQYASHTALLTLAGPILMPLLHLLFGVMVPILGFVALYGWAMSWHNPNQERRSR